MLVISAQRKALLDARDDGIFSADALEAALTVLDADESSLELMESQQTGFNLPRARIS